MQSTDYHLEPCILHFKNHHQFREGAENPSCGWIAMDMGNIVLHMLDQVDLLPSLVPKYVHCCQLACLNGYSPAKTPLKSKPTFFSALTRILACTNAKKSPARHEELATL